jgi:hypothetical protein
VLFDKSQATLIQYPGGKAGSYTIPDSVISIGDYAFWNCTNLSGVYIEGKAPTFGGSGVFDGDHNATVYYLPGTTGWDPQVQTSGTSFGVGTNGFGFTITGNSGLTTLVQACTNLDQPDWSAVGTNTLIGDASYFSDPEWTNYTTRFYRLSDTTFGGRPTALWLLPYPLILTSSSFGVQTNGFGFSALP